MASKKFGKPTTKPLANIAQVAGVAFADAGLARGAGGELHQAAAPGGDVLTTNNGIPISEDFNSLKAGLRGPTLLEDFVLREKISTSTTSASPSASSMPAASPPTAISN